MDTPNLKSKELRTDKVLQTNMLCSISDIIKAQKTMEIEVMYLCQDHQDQHAQQPPSQEWNEARLVESKMNNKE